MTFSPPCQGLKAAFQCRISRIPSLSRYRRYCRHPQWQEALRSWFSHLSFFLRPLRRVFARQWLFRAPLPRVIANLASCVYYLPVQILGMLFPSYPRSPLNALHSFVRSPQAIFATMSMAHDEMINIRRLDSGLLNRHKNMLWLYFAQRDDWVGQQKDVILGAFGGDEVRICHGEAGVRHAFCISKTVSVFSENALTILDRS